MPYRVAKIIPPLEPSRFIRTVMRETFVAIKYRFNSVNCQCVAYAWQDKPRKTDQPTPPLRNAIMFECLSCQIADYEKRRKGLA